jgi:hypothetical protein
MQARIVTPVAVVAMVAATPAVAEAHHVDAGGARCSLVGNVPTIRAWATFKDFTESNKPISGQLDLDQQNVETVNAFTFTGPDATWQSDAHPTTPGQHQVSGTFSWPGQGQENDRFDVDVSCPAPQPAPSPSPSPSPSPAPSPSPGQGPTPSPPSSPAPAPPAASTQPVTRTTPAACVYAKPSRYRITVTPRHQRHGLVRFRLHGPSVSHIQWYVDTKRAGLSGKSWEFLPRHGREYGVYFWVQQRWGRHLWGRHTIEARFRVIGSCGKARAARVQLLYFNHDPRPDDPVFAHPAR